LTTLKVCQMQRLTRDQLRKQRHMPMVLVAFSRTQFWFRVRPQQPAPAQSATVLKSSFAQSVLEGCTPTSGALQKATQDNLAQG
jgi:hypothetical protein